MKCADFNEKVNLLLDGEADPLETENLQSHFADCRNCREDFLLQQKTQTLLRIQPPILPSNSFDNKMLRAFENHKKQVVRESGFVPWFNFSNPFLKYSLTAAVFVLGFGSAFLFGRMSVTPPNNSTALQSEKIETRQNEKQVQPPTGENPNTSSPATNIETKIITKYLKVPVVKEKIVEKKVYITKMIKSEPQSETFAETKTKKDREKFAEQFDLKELQPVSKVSYKIIRKGESNEE